MLRALTTALTLIFLAPHVAAADTQNRVGDAYLIRVSSVSQSAGDGGSSGSSRSTTALLESILEVGDDRLVVEYDLPPGTSADDRARSWQMPARVSISSSGDISLLNEDDLRVRNRAWLEAGDIPESACGQWIFTWTAFKIECDPQSALDLLAPFDLWQTGIEEGAIYQEQGTQAPAVLQREGNALVARMEIDPNAVRRERAEADVVVSEIVREPVTIENALQKWANTQVSGTVTTTFDFDTSGRISRRTIATDFVLVDEQGVQQRESTTTTTERTSMPR